MKFLFFFALIGFASSNLFCQTDNALIDSTDSDYLRSPDLLKSETAGIATFDDKKALYQRKVSSYTKMKRLALLCLLLEERQY